MVVGYRGGGGRTAPFNMAGLLCKLKIRKIAVSVVIYMMITICSIANKISLN